MNELVAAALVGGAYLLGSVNSAILIARLWRLPDPRSQGSGNPGATNILRLGGRTPAALTLLGDVLKGVLPVLAARLLEAPPALLGAVMVGAFVGHLYPLFFGFRGGKGVATAFGALVAVAPPVAGATLFTWLLVALITRYSSAAALTAAWLTPLYTIALSGQPPLAMATVAIALMTTWRHRDNIQRLMAGTESRIGRRRAAASPDEPGPVDPDRPA